MLKPILIGGLLGFLCAPIMVATLVYPPCLFSEWYYQSHPNWDTAWRMGHGGVTFFGMLLSVPGFFLGMLAGYDWHSKRKKRQ